MKKRPPVAWWNKECRRKGKILRAEYIKHRRDLTNKNKLRILQHKRVIKFRKARKETWQNFVKSINARTPTKKTWYKFKKVNGIYKPRIVLPGRKGDYPT